MTENSGKQKYLQWNWQNIPKLAFFSPQANDLFGNNKFHIQPQLRISVTVLQLSYSIAILIIGLLSPILNYRWIIET